MGFLLLLLYVVMLASTTNGQRCGDGWNSWATSQFLNATMAQVLGLGLEVAEATQGGKIAVMVEPRKHPCISYVVRSVFHYLPPEFALQIFHGPDNLEYIKAQLSDDGVLPASIIFTPIVPIVDWLDATLPFPDWLAKKYKNDWRESMNTNLKNSGEWNLNRETYSQLMLARSLWDKVQGETVLVFQTDSWLCKHGIAEHLHFDYVGADWRMCTYGKDHTFHSHCLGGNGGLSLRKRSHMLRWLERRRSTIMEDYQIAVWLREDERKNSAPHTPPQDLKQRIFVEEVFPPEGVTPLGIHKIWHYQQGRKVAEILEGCMADLRAERPPSPLDSHEEL